MPLRKFKKLYDIIKFNGGIRKFFLQLVRTDDAKIGKLVGVDGFGNKYYFNDYYFMGRSRWVVYHDQFGYDYDASQVSPEWFGWLHYKTDKLPCEDETRRKYKWMSEQTQNTTGTREQYTPYTTTTPKIISWDYGNLKLPPKKM